MRAAFQASLALGGPHRLARSLGVQPDTLFRWIAGVDLPEGSERGRLWWRISLAILASKAQAVNRREADLQA